MSTYFKVLAAKKNGIILRNIHHFHLCINKMNERLLTTWFKTGAFVIQQYNVLMVIIYRLRHPSACLSFATSVPKGLWAIFGLPLHWNYWQRIVLERKMYKVAKIFSRMSIFPVDIGSLSPSYILESPSFGDKMMEINLK